MKTTYQTLVGIDRSDQKLDVAIRHLGSLTEQVISTKPEALRDWVHALRQTHPKGQIAICIEQPCANLAVFFHQFDFLDLFLINPIMLKRYRESFHLARAKDDRKDSRCLAELLEERHAKLKVWKPDTPAARKLRSLSEHRRTLVDTRTAISNQLTALLKLYFPHALELTGKYLYAQLACDFLLKWPTLQALKRAPKNTVIQFYRLHSSYRPKLMEKRLQIIELAIPLTDDEALIGPSATMMTALVKQLNCLRNQIELFEDQIANAMAELEDSEIFATLPGAGPILSARLAATFGCDRERFENASGLQCFTGIAPVTKSSGKKHHIHRRYASRTCPHFEHQSFMEWVGLTIPKSIWAKAYYLQQRERGAGHYTAIRALAYKWQRILFRCWKNRMPYDETTYLRALQKRDSPLVKKIHELQQKLNPSPEPQSA